VSSAEHGMHAL